MNDTNYRHIRSDMDRLEVLKPTRTVTVFDVSCRRGTTVQTITELAQMYVKDVRIATTAVAKRKHLWLVGFGLDFDTLLHYHDGIGMRRAFDMCTVMNRLDIWDTTPGAIELIARIVHHDLVDPEAWIGIEHQRSKDPKTRVTRGTGRSSLESEGRTIAKSVYLSDTGPVPLARLEAGLTKYEPHTRVQYVD